MPMILLAATSLSYRPTGLHIIEAARLEVAA
jgi:hypothetical protein